MQRRLYEISGIVRGFFGVPIACMVAFAGFQHVSAEPTCYAKGSVHGSDRAIEKDPKAEVKFGNAGTGTMFIHSVQIIADGNAVPSFSSFLGTPTSYTISTDGSASCLQAEPCCFEALCVKFVHPRRYGPPN
jgi:hypothetical protein